MKSAREAQNQQAENALDELFSGVEGGTRGAQLVRQAAAVKRTWGILGMKSAREVMLQRAEDALDELFCGVEGGSRGAELLRQAAATESTWGHLGAKKASTPAAILKRRISLLRPSSLRARGEVFDGQSWKPADFVLFCDKRGRFLASWSIPGLRLSRCILSTSGKSTHMLRRMRKLNSAEKKKFEYVDTPLRQKLWARMVTARKL